MAVRKRQTKPDLQPEKRDPSATKRRAVTDLDDRISVALDRLRPDDMPRYKLAESAGKDANHAVRMFARPPRQTWTVSELADYAGVLGLTVSDVLQSAGIERPAQSLTERILTDPELSASDAGLLVSMVMIMRRAAGHGS